MANCKYCDKPLILSGGKCIYCGKVPNAQVLDKGDEPETKCPACGAKQPMGAKFCNNCGASMAGSQPSTPSLPPKRTFTINGVSFNMILVEGGTFWMGEQNVDPRRPNYDPEADGDSVRKVSVDTFYIGETVVTKELAAAFYHMNKKSFYLDGENDKTPYGRYVSKNVAIAFTSELMAQTGEFFRIPTAKEWEFAARGGNKSKGYRFSGSNLLNDVGWYHQSRNGIYRFYDTSIRIPQNVMMKKPNELGLYDMSGLVFEVCGPNNSSKLCFYKGGCSESSPSECRVAYHIKVDDSHSLYRLGYTETLLEYLCGLRLALTPRYESTGQ